MAVGMARGGASAKGEFMTDTPNVLPLTVDEVPDITDALIVTTILMRAVMDWQADIGRAALAAADAADRGDMEGVADACRAFAAAQPAVERMADIARAAASEYDGPTNQRHPLPDPGMDARTRRALLKVAPWMEKRWLGMYGRKPVPAAVVGAPTEKPDRKACRKTMRGRLRLLDSEIVRLSADDRDIAHTARRIMVTDRNGHAARCRDCSGCRMARDDLTLPILPPE